jgi:hypothetical protein
LVKEHPGVVALQESQIQEAAEVAEAQQDLQVVIVPLMADNKVEVDYMEEDPAVKLETVTPQVNTQRQVVTVQFVLYGEQVVRFRQLTPVIYNLKEYKYGIPNYNFI